MSLKKFISGASALAVAATAFAAMAVTASAKNYDNISVTPGTLVQAAKNENGTFKTRDNQSSGVSAVVADLSGLTDIDKASTVNVEFDTKIPAANNVFGKLVYGVGDKSVRKLTGNGSSAGNYKTNGLIAYFGSLDGSKFQSSNKSGSYTAAQVGNKTIHATVTLDRDADMYSYQLEVVGTSAKLSQTGSTDVDNLTVIEAFTWGTQAFDLTFSNITVSYTVPDAPVVTATVEDSAAFTVDDGYDSNVVVGTINLNVSNGTIDLNNATYNGKAPTDVTGSNKTAFQGSALIAVTIAGATDKSVLNNVKFN